MLWCGRFQNGVKMAHINTLPEDVARQIAAGEVVERPASAIKELIENALDAGARRVDIRTRGAGIRLIEVKDDGVGIFSDELELAVKSFSTSKIQTAADLHEVATYGFRGEALASISAVSRFTITSSDGTGGEGYRYTVEGRKTSGPAPAPHERGTTVCVEDLFFNTPARKKFLKSDTTERRRILEVVLSFVLIRPDVEFHYSEDSRGVLDVVPAKLWEERAASILGAGTMKHMVPVDLVNGPFRLTGLVSLPGHTRSNRNHQFLYVNKRSVRERTMLQAVTEAYRSVIPYRRFPVVVLSLDVPPGEVDVNVHPNKLEVRLGEPRRVFETVSRGIKQALSGRAEERQAVQYRPQGAVPPANVTPLPVGRAPELELHNAPVRTPVERIRDATFRYLAGASAVTEFNPQLSLTPSESKPSREEAVEIPNTDEALFWQFNNAYIFIQVRAGVVVIDQHAAHERIIFDTSKERLQNEIPVSQQMLFPITLELSIKELEAFRSGSAIFEKLGFHVEPFGGTSILVRGYPHGLKNWNEGHLLREVLDDLIEDRFPGTNHVDRIIASFACRSAVKAGQKLNVPEMKMLADQLFSVANPYSCPHGRPTVYRIPLEEVERWFLRK